LFVSTHANDFVSVMISVSVIDFGTENVIMWHTII